MTIDPSYRCDRKISHRTKKRLNLSDRVVVFLLNPKNWIVLCFISSAALHTHLTISIFINTLSLPGNKKMKVLETKGRSMLSVSFDINPETSFWTKNPCAFSLLLRVYLRTSSLFLQMSRFSHWNLIIRRIYWIPISCSSWHSTLMCAVETLNGEFGSSIKVSDRSWTRSKTFYFRCRRQVWPDQRDKLIKFTESDYWPAKNERGYVLLARNTFWKFNSWIFIHQSRLSRYQLNFAHSVYIYVLSISQALGLFFFSFQYITKENWNFDDKINLKITQR